MNTSFQTPAQLMAYLEDTLKARYRPPAGALFTLCLTRAGGPEVFATGKVSYLDEAVQPRSTADYGDLVFLEEWIESAATATARLGQILTGQGVVGERRIPGAFTSTSSTRRVGLSGSYSGWTELVLESRLDLQGKSVTVSYDAVARSGLPPFRGGGYAIAEWVFGYRQDRQSGGAPNLGTLLTIVPDTRGRIVTAEWLPGKVTAELEVNARPSEIELQMLFTGSSAHRYELIPNAQGHLERDAPEDTESVSLFLVHSDGDLLADVHLSSLQTRFGARVPEPPLDRKVLLDLAAGENEEVEYKPFLQSNDEKEEELLRTVVAFANTKGGRIYVGVRDDGTLQGRSALCQAAKASDTEALDKVVGRLRKLIADKVKPVPPVEVRSLEVSGDPLVVVAVKKGTDGPYSTHENEVFIRKGSTNRRPDPRTELPLLFPKPPRSRL